jgi:hypothetical protein
LQEFLSADKRLGMSASWRSKTDSLAHDEAYLSWLEVPGGWVATLVGPRPTEPFWASPEQEKADKSIGAVRTLEGRRMSSYFVPSTPAVSSALGVYRGLLRSGGANQRGAGREDMRQAASATELGELPFWPPGQAIWPRRDVWSSAPMASWRNSPLKPW